MKESPWLGPSGEAFARMVRERLRGVLDVTTEVRPIDPAVGTPASYLVDVGWPGAGVLCEVADSIVEVRVMDPNGEDVSIEQALRYIEARAVGTARGAAWRQAGF